MKQTRYTLLDIGEHCKHEEIHITTAGGFDDVDIMCSLKKRQACKPDKCPKRELQGVSLEDLSQIAAEALLFTKEGKKWDDVNQYTKAVYLSQAVIVVTTLIRALQERHSK